MESCLLCLEFQNKSIDSIKFNSTQWQEMQVENLIHKHLWSMQTIQLSSLLCRTCWEQLHDFHKFYKRIEEAHLNFDSIIKIEIEEETFVEQTVVSELITEEQNIITEEYDQDLSNDDMSFIEIKKNEGRATIIAKKQSASHSESYLEFKIGRRNKNIDKFIADNLKLTCDLCQLSMESFQALTKHFTNEHGQKGYAICCNKNFVQRADLFDHLQQHLNPNYLKCKHCDKICVSRAHFRVHSRKHNPKRERIHCCGVCGLSFFTRHVLKVHKTTHLSEEEKQFLCAECGKRYGSLYTLNSHKRDMHGATASCELCGLVCVNQKAVDTHKTIKHVVGEYTCSICSKISPNQRYHDKHIKYSHQTDINAHKCTMCAKAFKTSYALRHHVATHTGTSVYVCDWSPKTFKTSSNISSHRKKWKTEEWEEFLRKKWHPKEWEEFLRKNEPVKNVKTTSLN